MVIIVFLHETDRMEEQASSTIEVTVKTLDSQSRSYTVQAQVSWSFLNFIIAHCHVTFKLMT